MGCYKKSIFVPEDWKGKSILLEFEGVYMNAEIHLNHQLVKRHIYGYTSFFCDLTDYVKYNTENELSINVNNDATEGQWQCTFRRPFWGNYTDSNGRWITCRQCIHSLSIYH